MEISSDRFDKLFYQKIILDKLNSNNFQELLASLKNKLVEGKEDVWVGEPIEIASNLMIIITSGALDYYVYFNLSSNKIITTIEMWLDSDWNIDVKSYDAEDYTFIRQANQIIDEFSKN